MKPTQSFESRCETYTWVQVVGRLDPQCVCSKRTWEDRPTVGVLLEMGLAGARAESKKGGLVASGENEVSLHSQ